MKKYSAIFVIAAITIAAIIFFALQSAGPGEYDDFALCLKEKGVVFYGAFWCPHCQNQKKLFGKSQKLLPYLECSTPDGRGELKVCTDKNITGYPTWEFADGSREGGEVPLEKLSLKSGCPLNQHSAASTL